jgi:hypothetical protein
VRQHPAADLLIDLGCRPAHQLGRRAHTGEHLDDGLYDATGPRSRRWQGSATSGSRTELVQPELVERNEMQLARRLGDGRQSGRQDEGKGQRALYAGGGAALHAGPFRRRGTELVVVRRLAAR